MAHIKRRDFLQRRHAHQTPSQFAYSVRSRVHRGRLLALKIFVVASIVALLGGWFAYFLFFHPYFDIQKIVVMNPGGVENIQIAEIVKSILREKFWHFFKRKNIYFFSKKEVQERIERVVSLESIDIKKRLPSSVAIIVQKRATEAILVKAPIGYKTLSYGAGGTEYYYVDRLGRIIEQRSSSEPELFDLYPVIEWETSEEAHIGAIAIDADILRTIFDLYKVMLPKINIFAEKFILSDEFAGEIHIVTKEGWKILLANNANIQNQISSLSLILEKEIMETRVNLQYVDLRIEGRVYYK